MASGQMKLFGFGSCASSSKTRKQIEHEQEERLSKLEEEWSTHKELMELEMWVSEEVTALALLRSKSETEAQIVTEQLAKKKIDAEKRLNETLDNIGTGTPRRNQDHLVNKAGHNDGGKESCLVAIDSQGGTHYGADNRITKARGERDDVACEQNICDSYTRDVNCNIESSSSNIKISKGRIHFASPVFQKLEENWSSQKDLLEEEMRKSREIVTIALKDAESEVEVGNDASPRFGIRNNRRHTDISSAHGGDGEGRKEPGLFASMQLTPTPPEAQVP